MLGSILLGYFCDWANKPFNVGFSDSLKHPALSNVEASVLNIYILQVSARQKRRRVKMGEDIKLKYEMRGGTVSYQHSYSALR